MRTLLFGSGIYVFSLVLSSGSSSCELPPSHKYICCVNPPLMGFEKKSKSFIPSPIGAKNLSFVSWRFKTKENRCPGLTDIAKDIFSPAFIFFLAKVAPATIP